MAGKTRLEFAKQILKEHQGKELFLQDLKAIIRKQVGTEKGIMEYLILMREAELIKEFETKEYRNVTKWKINKINNEVRHQPTMANFG